MHKNACWGKGRGGLSFIIIDISSNFEWEKKCVREQSIEKNAHYALKKPRISCHIVRSEQRRQINAHSLSGWVIDGDQWSTTWMDSIGRTNSEKKTKTMIYLNSIYLQDSRHILTQNLSIDKIDKQIWLRTFECW